ncbi:hypothetical protein [Noviherbaspirillum massiliense]|uniref:hypothetical protein n=1 Tax=Noviherbaspirillum massiliense TaxID=1465823 RepID=UPI0002E211EE|nr:hypothetical protein [Noviherbaspirillum massiliense]
MNMWFFIAAVAWIALCIPAAREVWRRYNWGRVNAVVIGHPPQRDDSDHGALLIAFHEARNNALIHTYLHSRNPRVVLQGRWPLKCAVEVFYNPLSPTVVAWPRSPRFIALCCSVFSVPILTGLLAWLWHALH